MLTKRIVVAPLIVLSTLFALACDDRGPTAPSPITAPSPSTPPSPPTRSPGTQVWNITVRLVSADGGECVGETMRSSQMEIPKSYSLSVTPNGSRVDVTLRSASGDYACTFPAKAEGDGFTTVGVPGFMSCETAIVQRFVCDDGSVRDLMSLGEDIFGHVAGDQITGQWSGTWAVMEAGGRDDVGWLGATYRFSGSR